jgi:hypothetical protein
LNNPIERELVMLLLMMAGYALFMAIVFFVVWSAALGITR